MTGQEENMSKQEQDSILSQEPIEQNLQDEQPQIDLDEGLLEKVKRIAELEEALALAQKNESEAMIRAKAEIDNVRKRVAQDIEKAHKFALEKFSSELLPVIDNLERALEATDKSNPELSATVEGLELTLKSFLDTVKKFGIEVVDPEVKQLNPDLHQAISMVESSEHQSGQIVNTIQKGYTLNGRLIRPAMVIVAK